MQYIIDIDDLARRLFVILRTARRRYEVIDRIAEADLIPADLKETALRLFWNTTNRDSKYPWECWDDDAAIRSWFKGYTLDAIGFADNNDEIYDEPSQELYREVIDPFCVQINTIVQDMNIRGNNQWEELKVVSVRHNCIILENLGDWRIKDWERIQREKIENREDQSIYY